jgi:hypothetical protein
MIHVAGDGHETFLYLVLVLSMTSFRSHQNPSVGLNHFYELSNFHS